MSVLTLTQKWYILTYGQTNKNLRSTRILPLFKWVVAFSKYLLVVGGWCFKEFDHFWRTNKLFSQDVPFLEKGGGAMNIYGGSIISDLNSVFF